MRTVYTKHEVDDLSPEAVDDLAGKASAIDHLHVLDAQAAIAID